MAVNEGGRPRRISRSAVAVGRALVAGLAVVVMAASGTAWWLLGQADDQLQSNAVAALYPDDPNIRTAPVTAAAAQSDGTADPGDTAGAAENILILGLDTRPPSQTAPGTGTSQSDVIMIAHVSADRQRVDLVSIPRDLMITAPTCKAWDYSSGTLSDRDFDNPYSEWKMTNAYAVGGPTCTIKAVQALTGVRIDRLIVFNFEGFKKIVDAMGGVTMTFPGPVVDNGKTIIDAGGTRLVNGDQALALVRARRVAGDPTGDLGRIGRQQQLLSAMLAKASSSDLVGDPARLNSTLHTIIDNAVTDNVTVSDLAELAVALRGTGDAQVNDYTVPTVPDSGTDGLRAGAGINAYFDALIADQPIPAGVG